MRHGFAGRRFNRTTSCRRAMFRDLACALIQHNRINTTLPKAKDLRPFVERLVTVAKSDSLHGRRKLISVLQNHDLVEKLISDVSKRFESRNGGYTRIMKNGFRYGDSAPMAIIEFVSHGSVSETK